MVKAALVLRGFKDKIVIVKVPRKFRDFGTPMQEFLEKEGLDFLIYVDQPCEGCSIVAQESGHNGWEVEVYDMGSEHPEIKPFTMKSTASNGKSVVGTWSILGENVTANENGIIISNCRTYCVICRKKLAEHYYTRNDNPEFFSMILAKSWYGSKYFLQVLILGICDECDREICKTLTIPTHHHTE